MAICLRSEITVAVLVCRLLLNSSSIMVIAIIELAIKWSENTVYVHSIDYDYIEIVSSLMVVDSPTLRFFKFPLQNVI